MKAAIGFIMVAFWCRGAGADCTVSSNGECEESADDTISALQVKLVKQEIVQKPKERNWETIICPFLANMVKHGFLEIKPNYNEQELFDLTVKNGLPEKFVKGHILSNFAPFPTGKVDIFDMEGVATEHTTSTGINDCPSLFPRKAEDKNTCPIDSVTGAPKCPTPNKDCLTKDFKEKEYNKYIELVDVNPKDDIFTVPELLASAGPYRTETNDLNLGIQGDIGENPTAIGTSFMALSMVFGETCEGISEKRLRQILFEKELPEDFVFPKSNRCDPDEFLNAN